MEPRADHRFHAIRRLVPALLLAGAAAVLGSLGGLGRADLALTDGLRLFERPPHREDIVVIAIDEASLTALGPLPWRESVYARLLETLAQGQPRVLGVLTPWSRRYLAPRADERALAQAVAHARNVILPVVVAGARGHAPVLVPPSAVLAAAAGALGQVRVPLDADGVARSVWLREGPRGQAWDHMALAMYRLGTGDATTAVAGDDGGTGDWVAEGRLLVPFTATQVQHVPLVDVIAGLVPPEAFRNRYVLLGGTAPGVGNAFTTPVGPHGALMPETDVVAAALQALLERSHVHPAPAGLNAFANALPAAGAGLALAFLPPGWALVVLAGLGALLLAATALLPWVAGIQLYPLAGLAVLALACPLGMGVRLFCGMRSLSQELADGPQELRAPRAGTDAIGRFIGRLHAALAQLRDARRLVSDSLDRVSDVILIVDADGRVRFANAAALRYLRGAGVRDVAGTRIGDLGPSILPDAARARVAALFAPGAPAHEVLELVDRQGRAFLLRVMARPRDAGTAPAGWIVSFTDIHGEREAQKQRDDALRFISHDMRAPQSSILSLIELHRHGADEVRDTQVLLERIQRYARSALDMSEDFVQFARAEAGRIEPEANDLQALLLEAADLVWPRALARRIRIDLPEDEASEAMAICQVDRQLMTRAFMNLLDNAIRFSPEGTAIHCEIGPDPPDAPGPPPRWRISVRDEGPGLPVSDTEILFEKFRRVNAPHAPRVEGAGLALAFVRAVVQAHGGSLSALNCAEQGAEFRISLPADGPGAAPM